MTAPNDNSMSNPSVHPVQQPSPAAPVAGQGTDAATAERRKAYRQAKLALVIEFCFVVIPFGVMFIVLTANGKMSHMLQLSEFSFAGIVLAGQGITKYISAALAKPRGNEETGLPYSLAICVVVGVGILFAGVLLYRIVEIKEVQDTDLSIALMICRGVIFVGGILVFVFLGGAGEVASRRFEKH